jgi:tetratricopeptide (TPR) repeat protein
MRFGTWQKGQTWGKTIESKGIGQTTMLQQGKKPSGASIAMGLMLLALSGPVTAQTAGAPATAPAKPAAAPAKPAAAAQPTPQQRALEAGWAECSNPNNQNALAACNALLASPGLNQVQQAQTLQVRAMIHARQGKGPAAITDLNAAMKLTPQNPTLVNDRGFVLATQNRIDEAIQDFQRASRLRADYVEPLYNLGLAFYFKGDMAQSIGYYNRVISMRQNAFNALGNRCLARLRAGQDPKAVIADCDAALKIVPKHAMNLAIRGLTRFRAGDLAGARKDCDAAIALEANFGWPYYLRGVIKARAGDAAGAAPDVAKGRALDPTIESRLAPFGVKG